VYIAALRRDPCAYCGKPVQHIDHIVPRVESGPDDWTNLTGACASCNSRKSTMSVLRFLGGYPPADGGSERWAGEFDGRI
jgi:5-methylcytosine-specific restriction endonuclease McrA